MRIINSLDLHAAANARQNEKLWKRIKRRQKDPEFIEYVKQLQNLIVSGNTLNQARAKLDQISDRDWEMVAAVTAHAFMSPTNIMLEWQMKNNARYRMALEMWTLAKSDKNFSGMSQALAAMLRIDEADIELKRYLGLIRPIAERDKDQPIDVSPVTSQEIELAQQRYNEIIEQEIADKLRALKEAQLAISAPVVHEPNPGKTTDSMEQVPLAEGSPDRRQPEDNIP